MVSGWLERRRRARMERPFRRLEREHRRLEDRRDDAAEYLAKWGFGMAPSERRRRRADIERLDARLAELERRAEELVAERGLPEGWQE